MPPSQRACAETIVLVLAGGLAGGIAIQRFWSQHTPRPPADAALAAQVTVDASILVAEVDSLPVVDDAAPSRRSNGGAAVVRLQWL
jgi:hypothetical protein